jgi:hypothetical protein
VTTPETGQGGAGLALAGLIIGYVLIAFGALVFVALFVLVASSGGSGG